MSMMTEDLKEEDRTPCEIYSRVMGYLRPTSYWNIGKQGEWEDRVPYEESKCEQRVRRTTVVG